MNLHFTDKEKESFLKNKNYIIEKITSWRSQNEYHGKVSFIDVELTIAFKEDEPLTEEQLEYAENRLSGYTVDSIFRKELKKSLLKL